MDTEYQKLPMTQLASLNGEIAVVTGAAQGFGYAIAERLAEAGAAIAVVDINKEGATRAVDRIRQWVTDDSPSLIAVEGDVSDPQSVDATFDEINSRLGAVTVLVNNAGVYSNYNFLDLPLEEFDRVHRVNLRGAFLCSQRAARIMTGTERGGTIVNVASVDALGSSAEGLSHYTTSKHGLAGMTKSMAMELGPAGIRVVALCPGASYTEGTYELLAGGAPLGIDVDEQWEGIIERTPLGRVIDPDEVGIAVAAVASRLFQSMHGALVVVDGGILVQPLEGYVKATPGSAP